MGVSGNNETGGGVGIFIRDYLQYNILSNFNLSLTNCEDIWIEVPLNNNKKITIASIYRHPSQNFQLFQKSLTSRLETLSNRNLTYLIGGDININYLSQSTLVSNYKNEIQSTGSSQIVKSATRFSQTCKKSLIDHIYTNLPETKVVNHCISFDILDHIPLFTMITMSP